MARGVALLVAALCGVGCAEAAPPSLAPGSTEAALPAAIWPSDPSLVTEIECPELDSLLVAQDVVCSASLDGFAVTVAVAIDETGAATSTIDEELFVIADAGDELAARLMADLDLDSVPQVVCDRAVFVVAADLTTACTASRGDDSIPFTLRLVDTSGQWTLEFGDSSE